MHSIWTVRGAKKGGRPTWHGFTVDTTRKTTVRERCGWGRPTDPHCSSSSKRRRPQPRRLRHEQPRPHAHAHLPSIHLTRHELRRRIRQHVHRPGILSIRRPPRLRQPRRVHEQRLCDVRRRQHLRLAPMTVDRRRTLVGWRARIRSAATAMHGLPEQQIGARPEYKRRWDDGLSMAMPRVGSGVKPRRRRPRQQIDRCRARRIPRRPFLLGHRPAVPSFRRFAGHVDARDARGGDPREIVEVADELARACDLGADGFGGRWTDGRLHFHKVCRGTGFGEDRGGHADGRFSEDGRGHGVWDVSFSLKGRAAGDGGVV
jgi:hypothetical protein